MQPRLKLQKLKVQLEEVWIWTICIISRLFSHKYALLTNANFNISICTQAKTALQSKMHGLRWHDNLMIQESFANQINWKFCLNRHVRTWQTCANDFHPSIKRNILCMFPKLVPIFQYSKFLSCFKFMNMLFDCASFNLPRSHAWKCRNSKLN